MNIVKCRAIKDRTKVSVKFLELYKKINLNMTGLPQKIIVKNVLDDYEREINVEINSNTEIEMIWETDGIEEIYENLTK